MSNDSSTFICCDCQAVVHEPVKVVERHGLDTPPFEHYGACPLCHGSCLVESIRCDCCGEYIIGLYVETIEGERFCENCFVFKDSMDVLH